MDSLKKICNHLIVIVILGFIAIGCTNQEQQQTLQSNIVLPAQNQNIWEGEMVYFKGAASGGNQPYTYNWKFGAGISPSIKRVPGEVLFNYEGAYNVIFIVKDAKSHVNTDTVNIIVKRQEAF